MVRVRVLCARGLRASAVALLAAAGLAAPGLAENAIEDFQEPNLDIELSVGVQRLDEGLMGESIDTEAGGLSIRHVDVSLPGDFPLPVEFVRTFTLDAPDYHAGRLGGWNYDIPFISARSGTERLDASPVGYAMRYDRCSNGAPATNGPTPNVDPGYWSGWKLYSPGRGGRMMLAAPQGPASLYGGAKPQWVTEDHWKIDCLPSTQNNKGEGFVATAPNGVKYYFDFAAEIFTGRYERWGDDGTNDDEGGGQTVEQPFPGVEFIDVPVYDLNLYATRIEDVHGNTVDYEYGTDGRLLAIRGSDGREITITYAALPPALIPGPHARIDTVTAHGRVWRYSYGGGANVYRDKLNRVELPDGRAWTFTLPDAHGAYLGFPCFSAAPLPEIATITHPAGMRAEFSFARIWNGRNNTDGGVYNSSAPGSDACKKWENPARRTTRAVTEKRLIHLDGSSDVWSYWYEQDQGYYDFPNSPASLDLKKRIVTDPNGDETHSWYNRRANSPLEGLMVRSERRSGGTLLQATDYTYEIMPSLGDTTTVFEFDTPRTSQRPVRRTTLTQGGAVYTTDRVFDSDLFSPGYSFAMALSTTRSSTLQAGARTVATELHHDRTRWILGLPTRVVNNGLETATQGYDALGRRIWTDRFGARAATYGYHGDGTLAWVEDALQRRWSLSNYHRGTPRTVTRPDGSTVTSFIDDFGQVTGRTDARGAVYAYAYDTHGRLTLIDRPAGHDDTVISYSNLGAGLVQTVDTGALRTITEHDAMLRPVRVEARALSSGGGSIFTRYEYDSLGRTVFESFPSAAPNPVDGVVTAYDGLGRVIRTAETVAPFAETLTAYLPGNAVRVTDPAGNVTTTYASGYGGPQDGAPVRIEHPLGLTTRMTYDAWGNLLTARQHGTHSGYSADETQSWAYDSRLRLCRHSTPQSGHTLYAYDTANQPVGVARGAPAGTGCAPLPSNLTVATAYDAMGRVDAVDFPDASPDIDFTYDANGNLTAAVRGITAWAYGYDALNRPVSEVLTVDGRIYANTLTYTADGRLSARTTPGGRTIDFAPDAHGRPTRARIAGTDYASGAAYTPDGQLAALAYGNGTSFSASFDARLMLASQRVAASAGDVQHLSYTRDALGRVSAINDHVLAGEDRSFTYDGLGRLTGASGPWGSGSYTYDLLNNIRSKTLGARTVDLEYDAAGRLSRYRDTGSGGAWRYQAYDAAGNTTSDGVHAFVFDASQRPVTISGGASGSFVYDAHGRRVKQTLDGETIYSVYGQDGTLLFRDNAATGEQTDMIRLGGHTVGRMRQSGHFFWIHEDHLGSGTVGLNIHQTEIARESFTPFGEPLIDHPLGHDQPGFTGHIRDHATGLTYAQARYYNPVIGRFLSPDPMGFAEMGAGYFNRYGYTANDPVNRVDPTGEAWGKVIRFGLQVMRSRGDVRSAGRQILGEARRDGATLLNPRASLLEKAEAGFDLASPVTFKEGMALGTAAVGATAAIWASNKGSGNTSAALEVDPPEIEPILGESLVEFSARAREACLKRCIDAYGEQGGPSGLDTGSAEISVCTSNCEEAVVEREREQYFPEE